MDDHHTHLQTTEEPLISETDQVQSTTISKNQLKRQAKRAAILAQRPARRAAERERKKARARTKDIKKPSKPSGTSKVFDANVIFDCSFDEKMSEKETISLDRQLSHAYSTNRKADHRFSRLICTSFNGKLKHRMDQNGQKQYERWQGFDFVSKNLEEYLNNIHQVIEQPSSSSSTCHQKIIYLTADSPNVLTELEENVTYVIGAIVDHNRYKNLCLNLAIEKGLGHAQLPIGEYMQEMKSRKVLTVNQVLEILLTWVTERDWRRALEKVIPQRKLLVEQRDGGGSGRIKELDEVEQLEAREEDPEEEAADGETIFPQGFEGV